jgi:NAD-dependent deacetylase
LIEKFAGLIARSNKIIAFTGAGVSTESGIPDFRSPGGIWSRFDPDDFTLDRFLHNPESRKKHWKMFAEEAIITGARPNAAHYAIAELERMDKLDCVITQNIDNIHQKAGNAPEKVLELHGNLNRVRCLDCGKIFSIEEIMKRLPLEEIPDCDVCHGMLKPDAIFFGEQLPQKVLYKAIENSKMCDLFIVIGSTLIVYPAAYMPVYALEAGAKLVIVNLSPTPLDSRATLLINGKAGEIMEQVMEKVRQM